MNDVAVHIAPAARERINALCERDGRIAWISLSRPERANALNIETLEQILDAFDRVEATPGIEGIILHGSGAHFCAGADLNELLGNGPTGVRKLLDLFRDVTIRIERSHLVVAVAVHGAARAGALKLLSPAILSSPANRQLSGTPISRRVSFLEADQQCACTVRSAGSARNG